ncbi:MAG TPA: hypothetical protein VGR41_09225 [Actinomycetota bacterium]|jgi:hypothetical protein|nr:hypothetical protein [Actinomycetota bacterium]
MKTRNDQRLRPLDQANVPEVWAEIERRATGVAGDSRTLSFAMDTETSPRRRITAAVVGLALGGASLLLVFNVFLGPKDGTVASPPGIFFPTQKEPTNAYPSALTTGKITESNGCILLQGADTDVLLIWPNGTSLIRTETGALHVLRSDGSLIVEVGDEVGLGGGLVGETAKEVHLAQQTIGEPIPPRCRVDGGYFLTSGDVLPAEPSVGQ